MQKRAEADHLENEGFPQNKKQEMHDSLTLKGTKALF